MRPKQKKCEHIGTILSNGRGAPWKKMLKKYALWEKWSDVVGPEIAKNAQPHGWKRDMLIVKVVHPTWVQELQYIRQDILSKIQKQFPDLKIRAIRFELERPD